MIKRTIIFTLVCITFSSVFYGESRGQKLFHATRIKAEYQYSDYFEYEYPDPVYFNYPDVRYAVLRPYIADFPEHRFLYRIIQDFDYKTSLTLRYHYSDLDVDTRQDSYAAKLNRKVNQNFSISLGGQYTDLKDQLAGWMYEGGFSYSFAGFTIIQPHFFYYSNDDDTGSGNKSTAYSYSLLVRQALNEVTALQVKYTRFESEGNTDDFNSNTLIGWLSRYFYSETAVHLSFRYHWNSFDLKAYSPEVEVVHYLNWASIIRFMYRYYSSEVEEDDLHSGQESTSLSSHSAAAVLEYLIMSRLTLSAKYRFYLSNKDVKMNTYLLGLEWLLK